MTARLPDERRIPLSSALIDFVHNASRLLDEMWETDPRPDSRAASLMAGKPFGSTPFTDVSVFVAAGTDHFRATATLIRVPESFSPSIAALTRSTVEVLGRAWWLLGAEGPADFRHRMVAARTKELQFGQDRGVRLVRMAADGSVTEEVGLVEEAQQELADARGDRQKLRVPGYTDLATDLMSAADVDNARAMYSFLSGASHGEASTVAGLGTPDGTSLENQRAVFGFGLSSANARSYSWALTHCLDHVITKLVDMWGVRRLDERWLQTRQRVWKRLDEALPAD